MFIKKPLAPKELNIIFVIGHVSGMKPIWRSETALRFNKKIS